MRLRDYSRVLQHDGGQARFGVVGLFEERLEAARWAGKEQACHVAPSLEPGSPHHRATIAFELL
ncbi:MAG: hypothetical protein ACRD44_01520 [Bryobacteraceae bacterium]